GSRRCRDPRARRRRRPGGGADGRRAARHRDGSGLGMSELATIFAPDFLLRNSLYAGVVVGFACPLIGLYFVLRRMVFLGVALPQVSGAGIALAFLLHGLDVHFLPHVTEEHWMALAGSLVLTAATMLVLVAMERRRHGTTEGRIGVTYVLASATAILLVAA